MNEVFDELNAPSSASHLMNESEIKKEMRLLEEAICKISEENEVLKIFNEHVKNIVC